MKKVCVLGLGYIGLPTALNIAKTGMPVTGVDINREIISKLGRGVLPFEEPGLKELFAEASPHFKASEMITDADVFIIAVPTPFSKSLRISDLAYVRKAAETISSVLKDGNLVILESTVPPGTSENLVIPVLEKSGVPRDRFFYAHCPERAIPGSTLKEMVDNDRIIGGKDKMSEQMANDVYSRFVKGRIYFTDAKTAEFTKLMENTFRDVNIALANEFAMICQELSIDVWEAISLANRHPRVNILSPGPGVGGHCIAVDPLFLRETSSRTDLIKSARDINDHMPNLVLAMIKKVLGPGNGGRITILGVSYKKNVDDTRESPALKLIKLAENYGYDVRCHDPLAKNFEYPLLGLDEATEGTDCILIITDHDVFRTIDPSSLKVRKRLLIDTRNAADHDAWRSAGFKVSVLGNGKE